MRQDISVKQRKVLASKFGKILSEDTKILSKEMQEILVDDMVTAFVNRMKVLTRAEDSQSKRDFFIQCPNEEFERVRS